MEIKVVAQATLEKGRVVLAFFKESIVQWLDDNALRQAAALAFYSIFSAAPLLVIAIAVAGFFFGESAVEGEVVGQIEDFVGREGAVLIENMLRQTQISDGGVGAMLISLGMMLFGALVIFSALQDALNQIWGVRKAPSAGLLYSIKRRLFAFVMIIVVGVLLLVSLFLSTFLSFLQAYWERFFDFDPTFGLWYYADHLVFLIFFTGIFAVVYRLLPDVKMAPQDILIGAFMTALLFLAGELVINFYLTRSSPGSVFGAAGTLVVLLTWIYYSWMTILMGAEMTQVWARKHGKGLQPGKHAVLLMGVKEKKIRHAKEQREVKEGKEVEFQE